MHKKKSTGGLVKPKNLPSYAKAVKNPTKAARLAAQLAKKKKQPRKKPVQKANKRIGRTY